MITRFVANRLHIRSRSTVFRSRIGKRMPATPQHGKSHRKFEKHCNRGGLLLNCNRPLMHYKPAHSFDSFYTDGAKLPLKTRHPYSMLARRHGIDLNLASVL
jgi:hypothetical protein